MNKNINFFNSPYDERVRKQLPLVATLWGLHESQNNKRVANKLVLFLPATPVRKSVCKKKLQLHFFQCINAVNQMIIHSFHLS